MRSNLIAIQIIMMAAILLLAAFKLIDPWIMIFPAIWAYILTAQKSFNRVFDTRAANQAEAALVAIRTETERLNKRLQELEIQRLGGMR